LAGSNGGSEMSGDEVRLVLLAAYRIVITGQGASSKDMQIPMLNTFLELRHVVFKALDLLHAFDLKMLNLTPFDNSPPQPIATQSNRYRL